MSTARNTNLSVLKAREAVRAVTALNHAGLDGDGWQRPSEVFDTLGPLLSLARRLPQALDQMSDWLVWAHLTGQVGHDQRGSVERAVADTVAALDHAGTALRHVGAALEVAYQRTSHLTGVTPDARAADPGSGEPR